MNFRIRGLEARQFEHLFALSDAELATHGAIRQIAVAAPFWGNCSFYGAWRDRLQV